MLDYRVKTFLTVCQTMNYNKTAELLNMTQPGVSQHIKFLEEEYNVKLFSYEKRQLSLTKEGEYLRGVLEASYYDERKIKEYLGKITAVRLIRIGITLSIGEFYLKDTMVSYFKDNYNINAVIIIKDTSELLQDLDNGLLDFIFCEGYFDKEKYNYKVIKEENIYPVCSKDFDVRRIKNLEDVFSCRLIIREEGSGSRDVFERYLQTKNYSIESFLYKIECNSLHMIVKMVENGLGISFLYGAVVENNNNLKKIKLDNFNIKHEFCAIYRKNSKFSNEYNKIIEEIISK